MLKSTRWSLLIGLVLLGASFGWSLSKMFPVWTYTNFYVPWYTALTTWLLGICLLVWAVMFRQRMKPENRAHRVHPIVAARTAALAMASSRIGSIFVGTYFGIMLYDLRNYSNSAAADQVVICALTSVSGVLLMVVGMWLEKLCRLPEPPAGDNTSIK